jgi:uncharacterized coiled-coil DUF342 family protein
MTYEDKRMLIEFVEKYDGIHEQMDLMQQTINELVEKRTKLLDTVDDLKEKEKDFLEGLIEKYGASEITPNKLMNIVRC